MKPDQLSQHTAVTAAACSYLLLMLLQRTEAERRGTIAKMIEGVQADRLAAGGTQPDSAEAKLADAVFSEALTMLERANAPYASS